MWRKLNAHAAKRCRTWPHKRRAAAHHGVRALRCRLAVSARRLAGQLENLSDQLVRPAAQIHIAERRRDLQFVRAELLRQLSVLATAGVFSRPQITNIGNLSLWAFLLTFVGFGLRTDLRNQASGIADV